MGEVTKQMIESKLSPNVVTLNSVMKAYAMKGDVRSTEYWFDEMKRHRIQPDGFSYLEIMRAYAHCPESKKRRSHQMGQGIPEIEIAMDESFPSASAKSNRRPTFSKI